MQLSVALIFAAVLAAGSDETEVFQPPQWRIREYHAPAELGHEEIKDIVFACDGSVWFATMGGGVTRIKDGKSVFYTQEDGLISNLVDCLLEDSFGGIWVGTREGICYIHESVITNFPSDANPNIKSGLIDSIATNSAGEIWFGTGDSHIFFFTPEKIQNHRPVGEWTHVVEIKTNVNMDYSVRAIHFDGRDRLWGTVVGLGVCNVIKEDEKWNFKILPDENKYFLGCAFDSFLTNNGFWIGGGWGCAYASFNKSQKKYLSPHYVTSIGEFDDRLLLVGFSTNGLFSFEPKSERWSHIVLSAEHRQPYVECIKRMRDGSYWIGTREGAYRISKSSWDSITTIPGGVKPYTRSLACDGNNDLYVVDKNDELFRCTNKQWSKIASLPIDRVFIVEDQLYNSLVFRDNCLFYGYNRYDRYGEIDRGKWMKVSLGEVVDYQDIPLPNDFCFGL